MSLQKKKPVIIDFDKSLDVRIRCWLVHERELKWNKTNKTQIISKKNKNEISRIFFKKTLNINRRDISHKYFSKKKLGILFNYFFSIMSLFSFMIMMIQSLQEKFFSIHYFGINWSVPVLIISEGSYSWQKNYVHTC